MSVKVNFEIGHEASIRTKRTPEGFTHDWEVYVRGVDTADIAHFVDKVVFQLHETFPKPKRVCKEPPYSVKESGYAGFNLPIEVYLKNRDEPKKLRFNYDLHLQQHGPPIIKMQKEKYVFQNPAEDFRRKLLKGGGMTVANPNPFLPHANLDHERNSRDSFTDEKPQQLIGKPKLGGDSSKKHKSKDYRPEEQHRPSSHFVNLFGTPIKYSPDPKKPSPSPKMDKKDKVPVEKDKQKSKHEGKEKDKEHREEKTKIDKEEKERLKEEKRLKGHKDRESGSKEKTSKRPAERLPSPVPPPKRPSLPPARIPKPAPAVPLKEEVKPLKHPDLADKSKSLTKPPEMTSVKSDKKVKKEKKSHDKDRESKKEHKKSKELKVNPADTREVSKPKDLPPKEIPAKEEVKKEKPVLKPDKPINKFSIENMLKDPTDSVKYCEGSKHKDKADRERKHKHKKKDKKRDEARDKNKEAGKEKKHKHDKNSSKERVASECKDTPPIMEKVEPNPIPREIDKVIPAAKAFKEKDRSLLTISPISVDTSSQSSSKSIPKTSSKSTPNPLSTHINHLSCDSNSDSDVSIISEDESVSMHSENNSRSTKSSKSSVVEPVKNEPVKVVPTPEVQPKVEKPVDKPEKIAPGLSHKPPKTKDKPSKHDAKEEKKQRKRLSGSLKCEEGESSKKILKAGEDVEVVSKIKNPEQKAKAEPSPRLKTDTKVQDDGVSSSLSDNPQLKCESPTGEELLQAERKKISPDYMNQLKELQHRIMTIQSNEELERVVNLIAETGKYEVTKKTFDFDLCLLDRTTVQQLQELIGESRA